MARTAHDTRDKLITIGQHLFTEQGVFSVPLRTVIEQAGQKNTSALHYHFGGREGLLNAIIDRHNVGIEAERAAMLEDLRANGKQGDLAAVVGTFVLPFARKLESVEGREFLRLVEQLSDLFDFWDEGPPQMPLSHILQMPLEHQQKWWRFSAFMALSRTGSPCQLHLHFTGLQPVRHLAPLTVRHVSAGGSPKLVSYRARVRS